MCVTDCEPSVVLDLFVITREQRQVLSSNSWVSSAGARDVSRRDAGVVRPSECELQYVSAATKRCARVHGAAATACCRSVLCSLQVRARPQRSSSKVQQQRSVTTDATQSKMKHPDRLSPQTHEAGSPSELAVCKDTRKMQTGSIATFCRSGIVRFDTGRKRSMGLVQGGKKK